MSETDVTLAWIEIYFLIASKGTAKQERFYNAELQERFYNAKLLCEEAEENDILV
jgi:hypothetical protein